MPRKTTKHLSPVPPTPTPQQAIKLLRDQLTAAEEIEQLHHEDPKIMQWELMKSRGNYVP
jgi:hypothetical protein